MTDLYSDVHCDLLFGTNCRVWELQIWSENCLQCQSSFFGLKRMSSNKKDLGRSEWLCLWLFFVGVVMCFSLTSCQSWLLLCVMKKEIDPVDQSSTLRCRVSFNWCLQGWMELAKSLITPCLAQSSSLAAQISQMNAEWGLLIYWCFAWRWNAAPSNRGVDNNTDGSLSPHWGTWSELQDKLL